MECKKSPASSLREPDRAVCIKAIIDVGLNKSVIHRNCHWEDANVSKNSCQNSQMSSDYQIEYCETCANDGCNGGWQMKAGTLLLVLSVLWNVLRPY